MKRLKIILEGIGGAFLIAVTILLRPLLRPWYRHWGATQAEARRALPGDEYVPQPKSDLTIAMTVHAPPGKIWPWFVQLGCQRAGWYSYDLLDNAGVPSAERIRPEFQQLQIGETVKAVPNGSFGFPVAEIQPERVLSLAGLLDTKAGKPADPHGPLPEAYFAGDQTFFLEPAGAASSRLIFRMRMGWSPSVMNNLAMGGIVEPLSFVMMRKMLFNVKRRAERSLKD